MVRRHRSAALLVVCAAFAVLLSTAPSAFAYPETSWPGRSEYGDTCWYTNCHGVGNDTGTGPHGYYSSTSNICSMCHTLHAAPGAKSLLPRDTITDTCLFCHDGTATGGKGVYGAIAARGLTVGASHSVMTTNVVPGGAADGSNGTMDLSENGNLGCGDCHSPHGANCVNPYASERARNSPRDTFRNPMLLSTKLLKARPGNVATAVAEYGSDWCIACHQGRGSGTMTVVNHPVDSKLTTATPYYYNRVPKMASDTSTAVVLGTMGRVVELPDNRIRQNRAFVMPYPRSPLQAGHGPICQQCHQNPRNIGSVGAVAPGALTGLDGTVATDNPRFQTFPHETTSTAFLVEQNDDLCTNCHPADKLP